MIRERRIDHVLSEERPERGRRLPDQRPATRRPEAAHASAIPAAPVFWGRYVLGDASYVNSLSCNATGSYQRTDTTYSRNFLNRFLNP